MQQIQTYFPFGCRSGAGGCSCGALAGLDELLFLPAFGAIITRRFSIYQRAAYYYFPIQPTYRNLFRIVRREKVYA
jgi:hypothetical protein